MLPCSPEHDRWIAAFVLRFTIPVFFEGTMALALVGRLCGRLGSSRSHAWRCPNIAGFDDRLDFNFHPQELCNTRVFPLSSRVHELDRGMQ